MSTLRNTFRFPVWNEVKIQTENFPTSDWVSEIYMSVCIIVKESEGNWKLSKILEVHSAISFSCNPVQVLLVFLKFFTALRKGSYIIKLFNYILQLWFVFRRKSRLALNNLQLWSLAKRRFNETLYYKNNRYIETYIPFGRKFLRFHENFHNGSPTILLS